MDALLSNYGEPDDVPTVSLPATKVNIAPTVNAVQFKTGYQVKEQREVKWNPEYDTLFAPIQGAEHPALSRPGVAAGGNNNLAGFVEDAHINDYNFTSMYHSFQARGVAIDPSSTREIHTTKKTSKLIDPGSINKKKRKPFGSSADLDGFQGPWAAYDAEEEIRIRALTGARREEDLPAGENVVGHDITEVVLEGPAAEPQEKKAKEEVHDKVRGMSGNAEDDDEKFETRSRHEEDGGKKRVRERMQAKSIFHGKELRDYLGRTFLTPPSHLKPAEHDCFLPKKEIHAWAGHQKGVNAIRFFPKYGHLVLSGSLDCTVKIWDVYNDMRCMRTYIGHSKAVRDICFSNDGRKFLSVGYDRYINLWDTETGECLGSFSNGRLEYTVRFNPDDDKQNIFLAAGADKKITQWDANTGQITQVYDHHLAAVNTVTFIDENRRFVTTSDDKSIRVWDFGIPVPIKTISEPHMHSMPATAVHPSGTVLACQSLDNQIITYTVGEKFRINNKKRFRGHLVAGYACAVNFSPDGNYIMSGDADGRLFIWDYSSGKIIKVLRGHRGVCIGAEWHPIEPSRVITCGWDGLIKYWD